MTIFKSRWTVDIPDKDLLSFIFDDWKHGWDRPLFVDADEPSRAFKAGELLRMVKQIGRGLREGAGVQTGDVVLMCSANRVVTPALVLGIICAGAIMSGANPAFSNKEISYQISDSGAKIVFAAEDTLDKVLECCRGLGIAESRIYLLTLEKGHNRGFQTLGDLLEYGEMEWERISDKSLLQNRIAALNYSSGTTGLPKGCMISLYNMLAYTVQTVKVREVGRENVRAQGIYLPDSETQLAYVPFYHAMGQQIFCTAGVKLGDTTYVMNAFSFEKFLAAIPKYRITTLPCVPPIIVLIAKHPSTRQTDFSSVRVVACGAAPLGADIQQQAERVIDPSGKLKIQQVWGMSEATLGVTFFPLGESDPDVSGVGFLAANMEAKIVDDDGRRLGYDEPGEILVRGPNIFKGYWRKEKETRDAFDPEGYYRTGDIALMKKSTGITHIVDRKKELIKVKGYQVAPAELEELLLESPDVNDAAVIGIQGEGTEHPRAYVVPARTDVSAHAIQEFVSSRVARYKRLTGGIVFVDAVPKSTSGKILRRDLRERAKVELQSGSVKAKL